jgi:hypothetical protein
MHDQPTRELRTRQAEQIVAVDRMGGPPPTSSTSMVVVTVYESVYPTAVGKYFAAQQVDPDGVEVEGGAATFATLPGTLYIAVLPGSTLPPVGTHLIVDAVGGRWVVRA